MPKETILRKSPLFLGKILALQLESAAITFVSLKKSAARNPVSRIVVGNSCFFTFIVPVAFLTTVPAEAMLGRGEVGWVIGAAVLALGLFLISIGFWRFALRFYPSASS